MTRDDEIKLKVTTIIDEAVAEKKNSRRQLLVWAEFACVVIMFASIAFALYLNNSPPVSGTSHELMIEASRNSVDGIFDDHASARLMWRGILELRILA